LPILAVDKVVGESVALDLFPNVPKHLDLLRTNVGLQGLYSHQRPLPRKTPKLTLQSAQVEVALKVSLGLLQMTRPGLTFRARKLIAQQNVSRSRVEVVELGLFLTFVVGLHHLIDQRQHLVELLERLGLGQRLMRAMQQSFGKMMQQIHPGDFAVLPGDP